MPCHRKSLNLVQFLPTQRRAHDNVIRNLCLGLESFRVDKRAPGASGKRLIDEAIWEPSAPTYLGRQQETLLYLSILNINQTSTGEICDAVNFT